MTTGIILLPLSYSIVITATAKLSRLHPCYVEPYTEIVHIRDCLNIPIKIETTRCRGQCYSEDFLIYEPSYYQHKHHLHCCSPNITTHQEIQVLCDDDQQRLISYPMY
jgi:hypothetical protein